MPNTAKENILKKIRSALTTPTPQPFPNSDGAGSVFQPAKQELELEFAEKFTKLQGIFSFCMDEKELTDQLVLLAQKKQWNKLFCIEKEWRQLFIKNGWHNEWYADLGTCHASITGCEALVARTGTMVLTSAEASGRTSSVYAPIHICIARTSQLVYDVKDGLELLKGKYGINLPSFITFASGPSRTADIEKTLVTGVHGPKEVYCFLLDG